ncbi:MAG: nitroreductase family protein [Bacteroidales bacterium]|nr:nitroreductase family protein [Bacteroidales bacterium]
MEALENIFTRRSIRKFKCEEISQTQIETLMKAAMLSPTARNTQSWHFIVVNERRVLNEITLVHPYAAMLKNAPLAIIVCGDLQQDESLDYQVINGSAATQNILLAAHAIGLGAVWLGVYGRKERMEGFTKLFKLPPHIIPISAVAIGYPDEKKEPEDRFDIKKIHFNKW